MASYAQWRARRERYGLPRVTWVCGPERVLVAEVADHARAEFAPEQSVSLTAGTLPEREVWASVLAIPPDEGPRLVTVREAQRLQRWTMLEKWLASRGFGSVSLVFESADEDFPHHDGDGKRVLAPPCDWLRDSSRAELVRCATPSPADLVAWVRRRFPAADDELAAYLLVRSGGDLAEVAAVCAKAAMFDGAPGREAVDVLCSERAGEEFADALVLGDRRAALMRASGLGPDLGRAIGLLAARLDTMAVLYRAAAARVPRREIITRLNVNVWLLDKFGGVVPAYSPEAVRKRRRILAIADSACQAGARTGVAEALAALW